MIKRRLIWVALALTLVLLIPAMPALADDGPPGDGGLTVWNKDYTVEADETIEGDLVVINGSVTVESGGTVEGSLIVWNGSADVDGDVEGVISAHLQPADPVVGRERQVDDRPPPHGGVRGRREHLAERPQMTDGAVLDDRDGVVVDERPAEAVGVGRQAHGRQQPGQELGEVHLGNADAVHGLSKHLR